MSKIAFRATTNLEDSASPRPPNGGRPAPRRDRPAEDPPGVWLLSTDKLGDRAQIVNLAEALGWPFEEKRLSFNVFGFLPNILLGASRITLTGAALRQLAPPWPDLVIASGRRSTAVARWIARRSGGRTRLVHIGRPWAPLALFDLVVSTPQYGLPSRPNVVRNALSLNRIDAERLAEAEAVWAPRLADLPRPLSAVIVGGNARPYVLDRSAATELGEAANALAAETGGSLIVTTSRRTRPEAVEALFTAISVPSFGHRWSGGGENPYLGFLALADSLVVTGDSASMLSEACATGKPVWIFSPPEQPDLRLRVARWFRNRAKRPAAGSADRHGRPRLLARLFDRLVDLGLVTSVRDMAAFQESLIETGIAARLGERPRAARAGGASRDLERAVERVTGIFVPRPEG